MDASPLVSAHMSGIGYCQAGQLQALAELYPHDTITLQYFNAKEPAEKYDRLKPYLRANVRTRTAKVSSYLYRLATTFLPFPTYRGYFGKTADVTHFFNYIIPPGVSGNTVVTVHDMVYKTFPETVRGRTKYMLDLGLKKSLQRADRIVTDSEFSKQEIIRYFPQYADKIRVVYCGVDHSRFYPIKDQNAINQVKAKFQLDRAYFLYLGTVEPRKNLERLIEGYHRFCQGKSDPPYLVLAGGKGWLDSGIYGRVEQLQLKEQVKFTGYVEDSDICPLMCGALAFVFPSIYEGFGMPPLEAMACGVPVLTSTAASLPEVVGDAALCVDPYAIDAIADGLTRLYADAQLRASLQSAGMRRAAMMTWESAAAQLYEVYKEVCGG